MPRGRVPRMPPAVMSASAGVRSADRRPPIVIVRMTASARPNSNTAESHSSGAVTTSETPSTRCMAQIVRMMARPAATCARCTSTRPTMIAAPMSML